MVASQPGGRLLGESPISLADGSPGREYEIQFTGMRAAARVFVVKDRSYVLVAGGPSLTRSSPDARKFLDSFKVTDPGPGTPPVVVNPNPKPPDQPTPITYGPDQTVYLVIGGLPKDNGQTVAALHDKLKTMTDGGPLKMRMRTLRTAVSVTLAPVKDPEAFAKKVDFGTVTSVENRTLKITFTKLP
jgi:hypothetical protein